MAYRKQPERRTFIQDRFEILIRRQKSGQATFNELTELDDIVNRDPELREKVIRESMLMEETQDFNGPAINQESPPDTLLKQAKRQNLFGRIKSLVSRIFNAQIRAVKIQNPMAGSLLLVF
jgi:hypothetical protein